MTTQFIRLDNTHILSFVDIEPKNYCYEKPSIIFIKERYFLLDKEIELEDYQINKLICYLISYLKSKKNYVNYRNKQDIKYMINLQKEFELYIKKKSKEAKT